MKLFNVKHTAYGKTHHINGKGQNSKTPVGLTSDELKAVFNLTQKWIKKGIPITMEFTGTDDIGVFTPFDVKL